MSTTELNHDLLTAAVARIPHDALSDARHSALANICKTGIPNIRQEDWKYTNLAAVTNLSNAWLADKNGLDGGIADVGTLEARALQAIDAYWITLSNGRIQCSKTTLAELKSAGVVVGPLSGSGEAASIDTGDALDHLNLALLLDGLHISIKTGATLDKPLGLLFCGGAAGTAVIQERVHIDIDDEASIQFLECHLSDRSEARFTNVVSELRLGASATIDHVRLQNINKEQMLIGRTHAVLAENSTYSHASFDFGGHLVRSDLIADIIGRNATVNMHGLYLTGGDQHVDNHTRVNHRIGPAESNEEYRGILNGNSRGVFNGKAIVFEGADGTDARQSNHNLLLSDGAEVNTKPELEIYADDVKCSHGATVGQLDAAALFYLQSRGISQEDAVQMLTRAFAATIVNENPVQNCQEFLKDMLEKKLNEMAISS